MMRTCLTVVLALLAALFFLAWLAAGGGSTMASLGTTGWVIVGVGAFALVFAWNAFRD